MCVQTKESRLDIFTRVVTADPVSAALDIAEGASARLQRTQALLWAGAISASYASWEGCMHALDSLQSGNPVGALSGGFLAAIHMVAPTLKIPLQSGVRAMGNGFEISMILQ